MKVKRPTKRAAVHGKRWNLIVKRDKGGGLAGAMREAITSQGYPACAVESGSFLNRSR